MKPPVGMPPVVRFSDGALEAIAEDLTTVPPERGGALMGFGGTCHLFVADTFGDYSVASWIISHEVSTAVGIIEERGAGTLMGTVHSHPAGVPDPSGPDVSTTTQALDLNPHLDDLIIAIVTKGRARACDLQIAATHRMSVHILRRQQGTAPALIRARVAVHPISKHLSDGRLVLPASTTVHQVLGEHPLAQQLARVQSIDGREVAALPVPGRPTATVLVDALHPVVPPLGVVASETPGGLKLEAYPYGWDASQPPGPQLAALVRELSLQPGEERLARVKPLVGVLTERKAVVVGAGSVGSRIAEDLVRCGVGKVTVIDPDTVASVNLARSVYTMRDIGLPKAAALVAHLRAINSNLETAALECSIAETDPDSLLPDNDLVVLATDDMQDQAYFAHWCYYLGIAHVACGIFRKGAAGEVTLVLPEASTSCWNCAVGVGSMAAASRPPTDYGLHGRLVGESALGPSINIISSVASQVAVGVLAGPGSPAGSPLGPLVAEGRTLGLVSTTPGWDFFPTLFADMAHQYEPQSVWLRIDRDPQCPVCGEHREAPLTRSQGTQAVDELKAVLLDDQSDGRQQVSYTDLSPSTAEEEALDTGPASGQPTPKLQGTDNMIEQRDTAQAASSGDAPGPQDPARTDHDALASHLSRNTGVNYRQRAVLIAALADSEATFRINCLREVHHVSYATARSDLSELVKLGYLRSERRGQALIFTAAPGLRDQVTAT
ncbi:MAG: ThiF family adenylyltransferase [Bifidobacteriaceae bacterium]|jgi:molybdopterin/thiamine biosynthesis adenylyltransferase|nr:ThiF family adenylyltransferase [Bifidobacteriaceae bacterium]